MSPLISRILLTIVLFPLAGMLNFITFIALERRLRGAMQVAVPCLLTAAFIAVYWLSVWRQSVKWNGSRVRRTISAGAMAIVIAAIIALAIAYWVPYTSDDVAIYVGVILSPLLWIAATLFVWRETRVERTARLSRSGIEEITCPACGYNLAGLHEARCPECGAAYTLDELLMAAHPFRTAAEIEQ